MKSIAQTIASTVSNAVSNTIGRSVGYGYSFGKTHTVANSNTKTTGKNSSISIGTDSHTTYSYKSYMVNDILDKLEKTIKKINVASATGVWKYSTYVFASDSTKSKNIANFLRATTQGNESYIDPCVIQEWSKSDEDNTFEEIKRYLSHAKHPIFFVNNYELFTIDSSLTPLEKAKSLLENIKTYLKLHPDLSEDDSNYIDKIKENVEEIINTRDVERANDIVKKVFVFKNDIETTFVDTTSIIGTNELSNVIAFPNKSMQGLPILTCTKFGREPHCIGKNYFGDIKLAYSYHMHMENTNKEISLSSRELSKHMFITGSTGSGKSNTVYKLLEEMCLTSKSGYKFMVVEPAKGEYSRAFKDYKTEIETYSTNPKYGKQLIINPFSFPKGVHILEHLDRLVEIFNVCWPMYAAMPAILKESIEKSYEKTGWDLKTSTNKYGLMTMFPTFDDVLVEIKNTLNSSDYSEDNKSDYTGALITRVKSLTNGINGLVFSNKEISAQQLFDNNSIIDLSRVGSSETKSLIMGIIVLKLQEYRMQTQNINVPLKHITVLEEAHNLLKKTSFEQNNDSSNLLGKSVEMISNAISEMRTYGEGFIIVDQAPGLLDLSVIRNTNTKIIMRLPNADDRMLVGKAIGLNEEQINEISRFECGVSVISQSDWIEPVLCKIKEFKTSFQNIYKDEVITVSSYDDIDRYQVRCLIREFVTNIEYSNDSFQLERIAHSTLKTSIKVDLINLFSAKFVENKIKYLSDLAFDFFDLTSIFSRYNVQPKDVEYWDNILITELSKSMIGWNEMQRNSCINMIVQAIPSKMPLHLPLYNHYATLIERSLKNVK